MSDAWQQWDSPKKHNPVPEPDAVGVVIVGLAIALWAVRRFSKK